MSLIQLPFMPFFEGPMLAGIKTCTSRTSRKGSPGDRFSVFGATFELLDVSLVPLSDVANMWKEEGCRSREHFIDVWCCIHPKKGFQPD